MAIGNLVLMKPLVTVQEITPKLTAMPLGWLGTGILTRPGNKSRNRYRSASGQGWKNRRMDAATGIIPLATAWGFRYIDFLCLPLPRLRHVPAFLP